MTNIESVERLDDFVNGRVRIIDSKGCRYFISGNVLLLPKRSGFQRITSNRILCCEIGKKLKISYVLGIFGKEVEVPWESMNEIAEIYIPKAAEHMEEFSLAGGSRC